MDGALHLNHTLAALNLCDFSEQYHVPPEFPVSPEALSPPSLPPSPFR